MLIDTVWSYILERYTLNQEGECCGNKAKVRISGCLR